MRPDREIIGLMLRTILEQSKDKWDIAPQLMILLQFTDDDDRIWTGMISFPIQPHHINPNPAQGLMQLGQAMRHAEDPALYTRDMDGAPIVGVAFICEGWARDATAPATDRPFADTADGHTYEHRTIAALDIEGHTYNVSHIRGEQPGEPVVSEVAYVPISGGRVMQGLRDVLIGIGRSMPADAIHLNTLATMRLDSVRRGQ